MVELIVLFAVSTLLGLGCLGAAVWVVLSPETFDLDKIFSIIVSLLMGLIFLSLSAWVFFRTRLRELWKPAPAASGEKATPEEKSTRAAKPSSEAGPAA